MNLKYAKLNCVIIVSSSLIMIIHNEGKSNTEKSIFQSQIMGWKFIEIKIEV